MKMARGKKYVSKTCPSGQATSTGSRKQRQNSSASKNLQQHTKKAVTQDKPSKNLPTTYRAVNNSSQKAKPVENVSLTWKGIKHNGDMKTETKSSRKQPSPPKQQQSIFLSPARNFNEIAADVIHADCFNQGYRIEKTIGEGAYAKVKLAEVLQSKLARLPDMADHTDNEGTMKVAIKIIEAKNVPKEFVQKFLPRELENHCPMPPHKNVVRVFEQFRTTDRYYVVMEYCSHGDLLDLINSRISERCKGLGEDRARSLFRMLIDGMHHIHTNGIVHRDLKCENVLLDNEDNVKVTDFGFSTRFVPGQSTLLKTSCGSFAYTAPEVMKQKPYDGTKSDTWSIGVILFAMLNGRLPFNDPQLEDLEEDQKMQRLRFERSVSFESIVLVRRILQYNPSNRPSTADILNDPWLTGKRLIPRQNTKPKWANSYLPYPPNQNVDDEMELSGNQVYFKGSGLERGSDATVMVNQDKNETVTLKSRTGNKKNIWITGPSTSVRPHTWPRSYKPAEPQTQNKVTTRDVHRGTSAGCRKSRTTIVVKPPDDKNKPPKTERKYKAEKEASKNKKDPKNCRCCQAEYSLSRTRLEDLDLEEQDLNFLDNGDSAESTSQDDDFRFPSPVKNMPTIEKSERDLKSPNKNVNRVNIASTINQELKTIVLKKKSQPKSSNTKRTSTIIPKMVKSTTSTETSTKTNIITYMVNQSTSHAKRVKYFRNRLMKMYRNDKVEIQVGGINGLPPLLVQSLNSTSGSTSPIPVPSVTTEAYRSPSRGFSATRQSGTGVYGWRPGHQRVKSGVKPKKIMMLHSTAL